MVQMTSDRQNEIDDALKRIHAAHKQVLGVLIVNADGVVIKTTLRPQSSASTPSAPPVNGFNGSAADSIPAGTSTSGPGQTPGGGGGGGGQSSGAPGTLADDPGRSWAAMISGVVERARTAFKENDELQFIKIRTRRHEFMVVPDRDLMLLTVLNSENDLP